MEIKESLKNIGLSDQESVIYMALLKSGGLVASRIAKNVGLKRTTVYPILQNLKQKGFVQVIYKENQRNYNAAKPQSISSYYEKKLEDFERIIPMLQSFEKSQAQTLGLRFIDTKEELERFYVDIINEYRNRSYLIIGNAVAWEGIETDFFRDFRYDRANANIRTRLLLTHDSKEVNPKDKKLLREIRFLPKKYQFQSTIDIFDNKILIVSPDIGSLALVVAIPAMTDIFRSIFEFMWDNSK